MNIKKKKSFKEIMFSNIPTITGTILLIMVTSIIIAIAFAVRG